MTRIITAGARRCIKNLALLRQEYLIVNEEDKSGFLDNIIQEISILLAELNIK